MIERVLEWAASANDPRFRLYREARLKYEEFIQEQGIEFQELSEENERNAASDERLKSAERCYREAIELSRAEGAVADVATAWSQLGMLLHLVHRWPEAEKCFRHAIVIFEELARPGRLHQATLSSCYYHLGLLDLKQQRIRRARKRLERSIAIDEALGDQRGLILGRKALESCPAPIGVAEPDEGEAQEPVPEVMEPTIDQAPEAIETSPPQPEAIGLTGPFSEPTREVLWILASSEEAGALAQKAATEACPARRNLTLLVPDFEPGLSEPPAIPPGTNLCGAVLVLDRDALASEDFRYWADWCISRVESTDDFRVFVHLRGMDEEGLGLLADQGDELLDGLRSRVHLNRPDDLNQLQRDLRSFLLELELIRDRARWHRWKYLGTRLIGDISKLVLAAVSLAWLAVSAAALLLGKKTVVSWAASLPFDRDWLGVLGGVPVFWGNTVVLALLFRGLDATNKILKDRPGTGRWIILGLVVINASVWLPAELAVRKSAFAAGIALGVLLEVARRSRVSQARSRLVSQGHSVAKKGLFAREWLVSGRQDPISWPLFSPQPRVFISYSRGTKWGEKCATELHRQIRAIRGESFIAQQSIPPGASWRRELDRQIGEAVVLIALCDRRAITRKWVAAEVIAALEARRRSGIPEILLLKEPSVTEKDLEQAREVFRHLLADPAVPTETAPRQIVFRNAETLHNLVAGLVPQRYQIPAVFPYRITVSLLGLALPLFLLAAVLALLFGLPALPVVLGVRMGKIDLASWLGASMIWWSCVLCSYALGFAVRQAIGARFDGLGGLEGRSMFSSFAFLAAGMGLLLPSLLVRADGLALAWSGIALWFGWLVTNAVVSRLGGSPFKRKR